MIKKPFFFKNKNLYIFGTDIPKTTVVLFGRAAEARNRIRIMRLRYDANKGKEVYHLTMCQPTARKAVRLQALLPTKGEERTLHDKLDKLEVNVKHLMKNNILNS